MFALFGSCCSSSSIYQQISPIEDGINLHFRDHDLQPQSIENKISIPQFEFFLFTFLSSLSATIPVVTHSTNHSFILYSLPDSKVSQLISTSPLLQNSLQSFLNILKVFQIGIDISKPLKESFDSFLILLEKTNILFQIYLDQPDSTLSIEDIIITLDLIFSSLSHTSFIHFSLAQERKTNISKPLDSSTTLDQRLYSALNRTFHLLRSFGASLDCFAAPLPSQYRVSVLPVTTEAATTPSSPHILPSIPPTRPPVSLLWRQLLVRVSRYLALHASVLTQHTQSLLLALHSSNSLETKTSLLSQLLSSAQSLVGEVGSLHSLAGSLTLTRHILAQDQPAPGPLDPSRPSQDLSHPPFPSSTPSSLPSSRSVHSKSNKRLDSISPTSPPIPSVYSAFWEASESVSRCYCLLRSFFLPLSKSNWHPHSSPTSSFILASQEPSTLSPKSPQPQPISPTFSSSSFQSQLDSLLKVASSKLGQLSGLCGPAPLDLPSEISRSLNLLKFSKPHPPISTSIRPFSLPPSRFVNQSSGPLNRSSSGLRLPRAGSVNSLPLDLPDPKQPSQIHSIPSSASSVSTLPLSFSSTPTTVRSVTEMSPSHLPSPSLSPPSSFLSPQWQLSRTRLLLLGCKNSFRIGSIGNGLSISIPQSHQWVLSLSESLLLLLNTTLPFQPFQGSSFSRKATPPSRPNLSQPQPSSQRSLRPSVEEEDRGKDIPVQLHTDRKDSIPSLDSDKEDGPHLLQLAPFLSSALVQLLLSSPSVSSGRYDEHILDFIRKMVRFTDQVRRAKRALKHQSSGKVSLPAQSRKNSQRHVHSNSASFSSHQRTQINHHLSHSLRPDSSSTIGTADLVLPLHDSPDSPLFNDPKPIQKPLSTRSQATSQRLVRAQTWSSSPLAHSLPKDPFHVFPSRSNPTQSTESPSVPPLSSDSSIASSSNFFTSPASDISIKQPSTQPFKVGDKVDGLCTLPNQTQRWFPAEVVQVTEDDQPSSSQEGSFRYTLKFNDGETQSNKHPSEIRNTKARRTKKQPVPSSSSQPEPLSGFSNQPLSSSSSSLSSPLTPLFSVSATIDQSQPNQKNSQLSSVHSLSSPPPQPLSQSSGSGKKDPFFFLSPEKQPLPSTSSSNLLRRRSSLDPSLSTSPFTSQDLSIDPLPMSHLSLTPHISNSNATHFFPNHDESGHIHSLNLHLLQQPLEKPQPVPSSIKAPVIPPLPLPSTLPSHFSSATSTLLLTISPRASSQHLASSSSPNNTQKRRSSFQSKGPSTETNEGPKDQEDPPPDSSRSVNSSQSNASDSGVFEIPSVFGKKGAKEREVAGITPKSVPKMHFSKLSLLSSSLHSTASGLSLSGALLLDAPVPDPDLESARSCQNPDDDFECQDEFLDSGLEEDADLIQYDDNTFNQTYHSDLDFGESTLSHSFFLDENEELPFDNEISEQLPSAASHNTIYSNSYHGQSTPVLIGNVPFSSSLPPKPVNLNLQQLQPEGELPGFWSPYHSTQSRTASPNIPSGAASNHHTARSQGSSSSARRCLSPLTFRDQHFEFDTSINPFAVDEAALEISGRVYHFLALPILQRCLPPQSLSIDLSFCLSRDLFLDDVDCGFSLPLHYPFEAETPTTSRSARINSSRTTGRRSRLASLTSPSQYVEDSHNVLFLFRNFLGAILSPSNLSYSPVVSRGHAALSSLMSIATLLSPTWVRLLKLLHPFYFQSCVLSHLDSPSSCLVGEGAFGSVYKIQCPCTCGKLSSHFLPSTWTKRVNKSHNPLSHLTWNSAFAVKKIRRERSSTDSNIIFDIYNEILCLEILSSSLGVCKLLDYGVDNSFYFLVFECGSMNLLEWRIQLGNDFSSAYSPTTSEQKTFPRSSVDDSLANPLLSPSHLRTRLTSDEIRLCLHIFLDSLLIVSEVHRGGVSHFDLKCNNFILKFDEKKGILSSSQILSLLSQAHSLKEEQADLGRPSGLLMLTDFGEASLRDAPISRSRGTLSIQSPEMLSLNDRRTVSAAQEQENNGFVRFSPPDSRSDIWSLGALFVELISGKYLLQDKSWAELFVEFCKIQKPNSTLSFPLIDFKLSLQNLSSFLVDKFCDLVNSIMIQLPEHRPSLPSLILSTRSLLSLVSDASKVSTSTKIKNAISLGFGYDEPEDRLIGEEIGFAFTQSQKSSVSNQEDQVSRPSSGRLGQTHSSRRSSNENLALAISSSSSLIAQNLIKHSLQDGEEPSSTYQNQHSEYEDAKPRPSLSEVTPTLPPTPSPGLSYLGTGIYLNISSQPLHQRIQSASSPSPPSSIDLDISECSLPALLSTYQSKVLNSLRSQNLSSLFSANSPVPLPSLTHEIIFLSPAQLSHLKNQYPQFQPPTPSVDIPLSPFHDFRLGPNNLHVFPFNEPETSSLQISLLIKSLLLKFGGFPSSPHRDSPLILTIHLDHPYLSSTPLSSALFLADTLLVTRCFPLVSISPSKPSCVPRPKDLETECVSPLHSSLPTDGAFSFSDHLPTKINRPKPSILAQLFTFSSFSSAPLVPASPHPEPVSNSRKKKILVSSSPPDLDRSVSTLVPVPPCPERPPLIHQWFSPLDCSPLRSELQFSHLDPCPPHPIPLPPIPLSTLPAENTLCSPVLSSVQKVTPFLKGYYDRNLLRELSSHFHPKPAE